MIENRKNVKYGNQRKFYINPHIIDGLGMEFTACYVELTPEGALTSLTVCDAYRYFVGQAVTDVKK